MIKRLLFIALMLCLPINAFAGDTTDLEAAWLLNETSGTRTDQSDNSNDLTDNNTVLYGTGQYGNAADFESTNTEYLSIANGDQTGLNITGDYTVVYQMKAESWPGNSYTYGHGGSNGFNIGHSDGSVARAYQGGGVNDISYSFSTATWYHLAFVYDVSETTVEVFVDGTSEGTDTSTSAPVSHTGTRYVGAFGQESYEYPFDGLIDDFAIFSRKLSEAEIDDINDNGLESFMGSDRSRVVLIT